MLIHTIDVKQPIQSSANEQLLWVRLCSGDRDAFGEIYRRYFPLLFRYCIRFTTDRALVKDMLQDFFSQLFAQRAGLSLPVSLKSYLMVSARRKLFRYLDKSAHGPASLDEGAASTFALELSPESILINRQHSENTTRLLQQKLNALTPPPKGSRIPALPRRPFLRGNRRHHGIERSKVCPHPHLPGHRRIKGAARAG